MRREKFVYNPRTLRYERVNPPLGFILLRSFGLLCAVLLTGLLLTTLVHRYLPSPAERQLSRELEIARAENAALGQEFAGLSEVVSHLHERGNNTVRLALRMDPVDDDVFRGGRGGHDAYQDLRELPTIGTQMADLREKVDRLRHQIGLQSQAMDEVVSVAAEREERLASIPSIKPIRHDRFNRSLENLSGFGYRVHPVLGVNKMHFGIDFNCPEGTEIQATGRGTVSFAGHNATYGNCVVIDHGFGYKSRYAHLSEIKVRRGDKLTRGELVGLVGSTGLSTGAHLHYEIEKDGVKVDPIQYCYDGLSTEEYRELVAAAQRHNRSFDE